jgi:hypothetical protein
VTSPYKDLTMTETAIPEDIRRSAKGLLWKLAGYWEKTKAAGQPFWSADEVTDMFAAALMAERERCAEVALGWNTQEEDDFLEPEYASGRRVTARSIAEAIRNQP